MVDYRVSDGPEALLPKRGGPFKMEELALMALLECPLCFEQLDVSAKVLPCQHTFCVSCLLRQEAAHSQLLCPECRAPVPAKTVEELPPNLLLVRLLEGLQGSPGPGRARQTARYAVPLARGGLTVREGQQQQESQHREKQGHNEVSARPQPHPLHINNKQCYNFLHSLCDFIVFSLTTKPVSLFTTSLFKRYINSDHFQHFFRF